MNTYALLKSNKPEKKFMIITPDGKKTIYIGSANFSDMTQHKNPLRRENYLRRHEKRENWEASGINTPGWWARHLLWSEPSIKKAIKYIEEKFNINIYYRK